jgi:hypothetical protein
LELLQRSFEMKSSVWLWTIGAIFFAVALVFAAPAQAQRGYGMHHGMWGGGPGYDQGGGWSYCPYCGSRLQGRGGYDSPYGYRDRGGYPMGPGMMGPGYGGRHMGPGMMGPGMMGPGYDRGYGYPDDPRYRRNREPLKKEEAKGQVEQMLTRSRNPNLKVGGVEDKEGFFVVDILTKNGDLVDKMEVDKDTGMMRSIY